MIRQKTYELYVPLGDSTASLRSVTSESPGGKALQRHYIVSDSAETLYIAPLIRGVQVDYLIPLPSRSNTQRMARETKPIGSDGLGFEAYNDRKLPIAKVT